MAFNIENRSSIRLNHILPGQAVDLCDFQSKKVVHQGAVFQNWTLNGNVIAAPKVIKSADQGVQMHFQIPATEDTEAKELVLVKDPDGFGAMFLQITTGEGEEAKTTLRRMTAYASEEVINHSKTTRHPPKTEKVEAAPEQVEEVPSEETEQVEA